MYFSDIFKVSPALLEKYGAMNISLINDIPLFIDPFLLFNSKKKEYQFLHDEIIRYVVFLRDETLSGSIDDGLVKRWFYFSEVKQNWLGYCLNGNSGSGLGKDFADGLHKNFTTVLRDFGNETITKKSHIEKLTLFDDGIGKDSISDFTTNLIKRFLLEYTQKFAQTHLTPDVCKKVMVDKTYFNYDTRSWVQEEYYLPYFHNDFVILTPKDLLTKDEAWINKKELFSDFTLIMSSVDNIALRSQLNDYFRSRLPKNPGREDLLEAKQKVIEQYPEIIDYFIRSREANPGRATEVSDRKVKLTAEKFVAGVKSFSQLLENSTGFYSINPNSYEQALQRVNFLKQVIENNEGYRAFYYKDGVIGNEKDLHILFRLTWFQTDMNVDSEVNNGRGPVDYKISKGFSDSTLVEFKLAKNSKLEQNLKNQVEVYQKANPGSKAIKVILFFTAVEEFKLKNVLKRLKLDDKENIVTIDARRDNKRSASVE